MKELKIKVHWSFFLLGLLMIIFGKWQVFLCSVLTVILHEMGHSFVGRKLGYKLNIITLLPYGATLSGNNAPFDGNDEIKIAVAGPLVNAFLIVIFIAAWWIFPAVYNFTNIFVEANIYTLCFNLLPVYPLDGGRVLNALLCKWFSRTKSQKIIKIIGFLIIFTLFLLFFISFFFKLNYMLGINALLLLIGFFEDDSKIYYQKVSSFDRFIESNQKQRRVEICSIEPVFYAYKKMTQSGANKVFIKDAKKDYYLSKNQIINIVLTNPINAPIKNFIKQGL